MSYNIDSVQYIGSGRLSIMAEDVKAFLADHGDDLPECSFFEDLPESENGEPIRIEQPNWYGAGSGNSWRTVFVPHVLPRSASICRQQRRPRSSTTSKRCSNSSTSAMSLPMGS